MPANSVIEKRDLLFILGQPNPSELLVRVAITGEVQVSADIGGGQQANVTLQPSDPGGVGQRVYNLLEYAPIAGWRNSATLLRAVENGWLYVDVATVQQSVQPVQTEDDDCCDLAILKPESPAHGDLLFFNGSTWSPLNPGASGQILASAGPGATPIWVADGGIPAPAGPQNGDMLVYVASSSTWSRIAPGTTGHVLTSTGTSGIPSWQAAAAVTDHGALTGLADDDHTQYLLVNGSRATTGALTIGGAGTLILAEGTAPAAASGFGKLYVKSSDSKLYFQDDGGTEFDLTAVGSGTVTGTGTAGRVAYWSGVSALTSDAGFLFDGTTLTAAGLSITGNTILGDAAGDTVTISGTAIAAPNGLNIDSNTFVVDSANNRVGIGVASPSYLFHVSGGKAYFQTGATGNVEIEATGGDARLVIGNTTAHDPGVTFRPDSGSGDAYLLALDDSDGLLAITGAGGFGSGGTQTIVEFRQSNRGASFKGKVGVGVIPSDYFLDVQPGTLTGTQLAVLVVAQPAASGGVAQIVGSGARSAGTVDYGLYVALSGYTGGSINYAVAGQNGNAGTSTETISGTSGRQPTTGIYGQAFAAGSGSRTGVYGTATGSTDRNYGGLFTAIHTGSGANIGAAGIGWTANTGASIGVLALLMPGGAPNTDANITLVDSALLVDNRDAAMPIAIFRDNGSPVFTIADGGDVTIVGTSTGYNFNAIRSTNGNIGYFSQNDTAGTAATSRIWLIADGVAANTPGAHLTVQSASYTDAFWGTYAAGKVLLASRGSTTRSDLLLGAVGAGTGGKIAFHVGANNEAPLATNEKLSIAETSAVFNEGGVDFDVRFEGDNDANLLSTDGALDRVGIGVAAGSHAAKLHIHTAAGSNPSLLLSDGDIAHGMTSYFPTTDAMLYATPFSSTDGGAWVMGASDANTVPGLYLQGVTGSASAPTVAGLVLNGAKKNAATVQAMASGESVVRVETGVAGSATSIADFVLNGNGRLGINTTGTNVSANLHVHAAAGASPSVMMTDADVAHGMTTEMGNTDAVMRIGTWAGNDGGLIIYGATDTNGSGIAGISLQGIIGASMSGSGGPGLRINGAKKNGTTVQPMAVGEVVFQVETGVLGSATTLLQIDGASNWTFPADTAFTLTGGVNGLNIGGFASFDSTSSGRLGLGTTGPQEILHTLASAAGQRGIREENQNAAGSVMVTQIVSTNAVASYETHGASAAGTTFGISNAGLTKLYVAGSASTGLALGATTSDPVYIGTNDVERATWGATTGVVFNEPGNDYDFRVESDNLTHAVFVDASADAVGINTSAPEGILRIGDVANMIVRQATVNTTDATVTTLQTIATTTDTTLFVEARITARRTGGAAGAAGDTASYIRRATVKNIAGAVSVSTVTDGYTFEDQAGWDATIDFTGTDARVRVTGATDNNVTWTTTTLIHRV